MEFVTSLINSPILYILTFVGVLILIFSGKLKINSKSISINNSAADNERYILRNQIEYSQTFCKGLLRRFPEDKDKYRQLYIIEMIYNEITAVIAFNHLTTNKEYISVKQEKIWNIASTVCDDEIYRTDEFKDLIFERTEKLINELYKIRQLAGNH